MPKVGDMKWTGASGTAYPFEVYTKETSFNNVAAVYIFTRATTKQDGGRTHAALYIGETGELGDRLANHEKWPSVNRNGVTHICVHVSRQTPKQRSDEEKDLRKKENPPCNDQ